MKAMCLAGVLLVSVGVAACDRIVDPPLPGDAEQFSPPAVYNTWWNMAQACSGLTGSLGAVTWFKTSEVMHDPNTGETIAGYWSAASNRILLASGEVLDGATVRHEMLHSLIRSGGHPRSQFLGKCAGTVPCNGSCIREAGPYHPPPETPIGVGGESLDITVDVEPASPSSDIDGGFFSITVLVRNRSTHWATVVPSSPQTNPILTFSYDVRGSFGGSSISLTSQDPSDRIFAPGETKKTVFDFSIGDAPFASQLPPGEYTVSGGYSDYQSVSQPLVIGQ
jgi:hypothetical protein